MTIKYHTDIFRCHTKLFCEILAANLIDVHLPNNFSCPLCRHPKIHLLCNFIVELVKLWWYYWLADNNIDLTA